jgi:hypothetical protein
MVWLYVKTLWHQWKVFLTGGSLMAATVIYSFATAQAVSRPWGWGLIAGTFVLASYGAWKQEYERSRSAEADSPRMGITHVSAWGGSEQQPQYYFTVNVRLENPGKEATSFSTEWLLDVIKADGKEVQGIRGTMLGESHPLQQGDQLKVGILFPYGFDIPDNTALFGARFVLTVADIRGRLLRAEWPTE